MYASYFKNVMTHDMVDELAELHVRGSIAVHVHVCAGLQFPHLLLITAYTDQVAQIPKNFNAK
jgi:hypothetical protein